MARVLRQDRKGGQGSNSRRSESAAGEVRLFALFKRRPKMVVMRLRLPSRRRPRASEGKRGREGTCMRVGRVCVQATRDLLGRRGGRKMRCGVRGGRTRRWRHAWRRSRRRGGKPSGVRMSEGKGEAAEGSRKRAKRAQCEARQAASIDGELDPCVDGALAVDGRRDRRLGGGWQGRDRRGGRGVGNRRCCFRSDERRRARCDCSLDLMGRLNNRDRDGCRRRSGHGRRHCHRRVKQVRHARLAMLGRGRRHERSRQGRGGGGARRHCPV